MNLLFKYAVLITISVLLIGLQLCCSGNQNIFIPTFDGERAFGYLEKQVSFGPRVPGSDNNYKCRQYLISLFENQGAKVDTISFVHNDKQTGQPIEMVNIIAHFNGSDTSNKKRYLIGAHYDSRPRAEYDPDLSKRENWIDGANDGASGVAVLIELGNLFAEYQPRANFDLVLFDGEDYGPPGHLDEYFLGAREMVRRNIKGKYEFALVVDMIGDKDLEIYREAFSNKYYTSLVDDIWNTAAELGETTFVDSVGHEIHDDHLSFMTIKLPAAVIIDFDYIYWHTTSDNVDKCSPQSLKSVGNVLTTFLYRL